MRKLPPSKQLVAEYKSGGTLKAIGDRYGATAQAVYYHLEKAGVRFREWRGENLRAPSAIEKARSAHASGLRVPNFRDLPMDEMRKEYESGISTVRLAARYGVAAKTINTKLHQAGVPMRPAGFGGWHTALDGDVVQSQWELLVDNWLFDHNIPHECRPTLPFACATPQRPPHADFLAKGWYIEVWGVTNNRAYSERRLAKTAQYIARQMPLIEIWPHHITHEKLSPLNVLL